VNHDGVRTVLLSVIVATFSALGGYFTAQVRQPPAEPRASGEPEFVADNALILPPELKLVVGEPAELRADTRGKRVVWMSLDKEVSLRPADAKSVWVWAQRPGSYRVIAWTAVGGLPTSNATCIIQAAEQKAGDDKSR
jgi:hypothetical protein